MSVVFRFFPTLTAESLSVIKNQTLPLLLSFLLLSLLLLFFAPFSYAQESVVASSSAISSSSTVDSVTPAGLQDLPASTVPAASKPIATNNTAAPIGSGRHLMSVTLALLGIIGLIFGLSWFVKRFNQGSFSANAHIKILSAMPLGTRERIVLIEAGGQQLLLGITPTNINTLHVFENPIVMDSNENVQSDFSRKLMSILQQKTSLSSMQNPNNKNNSAP